MAKITATYRKTAIAEATKIFNTKDHAIRQQFESKPENRLQMVPYLKYPTVMQCILRLAGFESPAVLKYEGADLEKSIKKMGNYVNPQEICNSTNEAEAERIKVSNEEVKQRHNVEVMAKVSRLKHAYEHCICMIREAKDVEFVDASLNTFKESEF